MSIARIKHILTPDTNIKDRFVPDYKELKEIVDQLKKGGYRIVLTQGVYDLIHEGHALYLEAAKSKGDILIVGVDSDELTRKLKGPTRPIVPQEERIKMLVHLRHVDIVTLRRTDSSIGELIRLVKPDVLVTSSSTKYFTAEQKKAYDKYCGKILTLAPQATTSTTARIRILSIDGAQKLAKEINNLIQGFITNSKKS